MRLQSNGNGALTSGARFSKQKPFTIIGTSAPCPVKTSIQFPITPNEGSRVSDILPLSGSRGVLQTRVKELLANKFLQTYKSEGVRISALIQQTAACSDTSDSPNPIVIPICPSLPTPPGPPASTCWLGKNQKY